MKHSYQHAQLFIWEQTAAYEKPFGIQFWFNNDETWLTLLATNLVLAYYFVE